MFVGGEIIPSYAQILAGEDSEDDECPGYMYPGQTFNTRVITIDLRNTNHAFNQAAFNSASGGRRMTPIGRRGTRGGGRDESDLNWYSPHSLEKNDHKPHLHVQ